jgi:Helix-turn-helix domain
MNVSGDNLTPGEILSSARRKASLSLEQVAESTRIPANMLHAIEMDEYHKISGDLYVKSFLRAYSQEVGLDPEEMVEKFKAYTGVVSVENEPGGQSGWDENDVKIKRVGLPWGWISFLVVVVALAIASFYWSGLGDSDTPESAKISEKMVAKQPEEILVAGTPPEPTGAVSSETPAVAVVRNDTLAQGWQLEKESEPEVEVVRDTPPVRPMETVHPQALPGDPNIVFRGGRQWPYVVRLVTAEIGSFGVKRDAEKTFRLAEFPANKIEAIPLPEGEIVSGRAYAVREGYAVYWGMADHLSLRLGQVSGVQVTFNGFVQDLGRYRDGEEILLDSSRLGQSAGN